MKVEVLNTTSARLWFDAVPSEPVTAEKIARAAAALGCAPLDTQARLVVIDGGTPFARVSARVTDGCIRIAPAQVAAGTTTDRIEQAMALLLDGVSTLRQDAGLARLAIESLPGDDAPHADLWLRALEDRGYARTCVYRVYAATLDGVQPTRPVPEGVSFETVARAGERIVVTAGVPLGTPGATNLLRVAFVGGR